MTNLRLLVVDDSKTQRLTLRRRLEGQPAEIVGVASDGDEALARVQELRPDVVPLDLVMWGRDGHSAPPHLLRRPPTARVAVASSTGADNPSRAYLAKRVATLFGKPSSPETVVRAIASATERRREAV